MSSTLQHLIDTKNKIATPDKFIQKWYCAKENGQETFLGNPDACKFCIKGAVYTATPTDRDRSYAFGILEAVAKEMYPQPERFEGAGALGEISAIVYVNDELGFDAVHRVLDETIRRVKDGWELYTS